MGGFLKVHEYFGTIHKLENELTICIICKIEYIYQSSKLVNVINNNK